MSKLGRPSIFSPADDAEILRYYPTEGVAMARRLGVATSQIKSRATYLGVKVDESVSRRAKQTRALRTACCLVRVSSVFALGEVLA